MQNNLRNRSVALASTFALALTGIVATAPAAQAQTPVGLSPSSGINTGAFVTDAFSMDIDIPTNLTPSLTAIRIDNPGNENFVVSFPGTGTSEVTVRAFTATGAQIDDLAFTGEVLASAAGSVASADSTLEVLTNSSVAGRETEFVVNAGKTDAKISTFVISNLDAEVGTETGLRAATAKVEVQLLETLETSGTTRFMEYGDGTADGITITAWNEIEATPDFRTVDSATSSAAATISWYDPKAVSLIPTIERYVKHSPTALLNDVADQDLAGKVRFVRPGLNLDQVDLTKWDIEATAEGTALGTKVDLNSNQQRLAGTSASKKHDTAGAVYFEYATGGVLEAGSLYTIRVTHETADTRNFNSGGYSVPTNSEDYSIYPTVTDSANAFQDNTAPNASSGTLDRDVELRPGTSAFTYNARLYERDSGVREKDASALVLAVVTAGSFMPTGTELTVSGSSTTLSSAGAATIVSGLTDSNGDFSVTVTSSNPVALTSYEVDFYSVAANDNIVKSTGGSLNQPSELNLTYTAAAVTGASALKLASTVEAGETITISAEALDIFAQGTNKSGTKDLFITAQATSTTNLNETVAVAADGSATITFDNYVAEGESDVVTVYLHTGAYVSGKDITNKTVSIYNPGDVAGVNTPASVSGNITYDDFILGKASSTNVAPNDNEIDVTGTVVDANGAGVPGAVVTVDADGFQLREKDTGNYFQDSITFTADAAGRFTVRMWTHTVNPTGVDVTITSGGQSATTEVKTYLPTGLSGGNLVFDLDVPANIDANKTYAIQASLTDKWGNPVRTTGTKAVSIQGFGSVNINSKDSEATEKDFRSDGTVTVFLRSLKDVEGPGSVQATLANADYFTSATQTATLSRTEVITDVAGTAHDETSFSNEIERDVNVGDAVASSDQKVNAGSFKGYVAVYALGYEGQRLSAKIGNDWVIVDPIVNNESANLARVTDFIGAAGVDIQVRIYIDRVLIDTIPLTTTM